MHGLINRSIQLFITDTYGPDTWLKGADAANAPRDGFEAMLNYEDILTERMVQAFSEILDKPREMLMEDIGTYLVSNPRLHAVRRLLRFGGETFVEFLHSLDSLNDRARLAVYDLDVPELEVFDDGEGVFRLICRWRMPGAGHLMIGVLRAMADDYGALVLLDYSGWDAEGNDAIHVDLLDDGFSSGRQFQLAKKSEGVA